MGYRIDYQPIKKIRRRETYRSRTAALTGLFSLLFLLLTCFFWPQGREVLWSILLPGDAAVTASALNEMILSMEQGTGLQSCLTQFCRQIMEGANLAAY